MTFSDALIELKNGRKLVRAGWNSGDQYIYHVPAAKYPAMTKVAKEEFGEDADVPYTAYLAIKTVQKTVAPWLASQTDLLSDDWQFAKEDE